MLSLLLAAAFAFTPQDAHRAYEMTQAFVSGYTPRDAGTIRGKIAANFILDEASKTGADVRRDVFSALTPQGSRSFTNLYCEFQSDPTSRWVVVVSHYDTKSGVACPGANDGGATTGLLISLAGALCNWRTPHGNVMLIWTDGEECMNAYGPDDGLWGSRRAAAYLAERDRKVQAVLCLDMLGDKDLRISVPSNVTPTLSKIAVHAARRIGQPDLVSPISEIVKDDHVPFLEKGFRAVDLIDFEYGPNNSFWHTEKDSMENISEKSLLTAGRLVAELLNILL